MYRSSRVHNLRGAVNDADALDRYLRTELHVPDSQIVNLRDGNATRRAMISELRALRTKKTIRKGDPILIFFAGHGATAKAPEGWATANQTISLIMPHDSLARDMYGRYVQPIPDRTIGALLHDLAEQEGDNGKGNNIVSTSHHRLYMRLIGEIVPDGDSRLLSFWLWHARNRPQFCISRAWLSAGRGRNNTEGP